MSITEAAKSGNKRETLEELRDLIAKQLEACESGRDMAALSKRLMEVIGELEALPDPNAGKSKLQNARSIAKARKNG